MKKRLFLANTTNLLLIYSVSVIAIVPPVKSLLLSENNPVCDHAKVNKVTGTVMLKRSSEPKQSREIKKDDLLCRRDTLDIQQNSTITITCKEEKTPRDFKTKEKIKIADICNNISNINGKLMRGKNNSGIPEIITPGNNVTILSDNNRPKIRWHQVQNAKYVVQINMQGKGKIWQSEETENNEIKYPDSAPELIPGPNYTLIVKAMKINSSPVTAEATFSILDKSKTDEKLTEINKIKTVYQDQPDIKYMRLGNEYKNIGDIKSAKTNFSLASQTAKTQSIKGLAEVQLMLITEGEEAKKHENNARLIYEKLGGEELKEFQNWIDDHN